MTARNVFKAAFFTILVLLLSIPAVGQENGPVVQRLSWLPVDYALKYEVVVEIHTRVNTWMEIFRRNVENETFVDCPLFIGSYRFRVGVYDLLGNPGPSTDWVYFERRSSQENTVPVEAVPAELPENIVRAPDESEKTIFRLEILYQPLIVLPFSDFNEIYATSPIQPLGFALRFSVMPYSTPAGVFGLELSPSWNFLANDILVTSRYTHIINTHISLLWQIRPFSRNSALNFRLGGGFVYISSHFGFNQQVSVVNVKAWNPSVAVGVSFISFLNKQLFLNAGLDYFHIFAGDNLSINYLRPVLSLGWWI